MKVARFKGSYGTHTHIPIYMLLWVLVAWICPPRKFPYARLHYGILSETSNSRFRLFSALTRRCNFSYLPIVRVTWSNKFFARLSLSCFIRDAFFLLETVQGMKNYSKISLYKMSYLTQDATSYPALRASNYLNNFIMIALLEFHDRAYRGSGGSGGRAQNAEAMSIGCVWCLSINGLQSRTTSATWYFPWAKWVHAMSFVLITPRIICNE